MSLKSAPVSEEVEHALQKIGRLLEAARKSRGDTLAILAYRLGVHRQTVTRMELGDPGVGSGLLFQALHVYGLTDRLFDLSRPDPVSQTLLQRRAEQKKSRAVA